MQLYSFCPLHTVHIILCHASAIEFMPTGPRCCTLTSEKHLYKHRFQVNFCNLSLFRRSDHSQYSRRQAFSFFKRFSKIIIFFIYVFWACMPLFGKDSREIETGQYRVDRGVQDRHRTRSRDSNSGSIGELWCHMSVSK